MLDCCFVSPFFLFFSLFVSVRYKDMAKQNILFAYILMQNNVHVNEHAEQHRQSPLLLRVFILLPIHGQLGDYGHVILFMWHQPGSLNMTFKKMFPNSGITLASSGQ